MGIGIATGIADAPTGTGTVDFTVSGFGTPLLAKFAACYGVTQGTAAAQVCYARGATDGTRQWTVGVYQEDNTTVTDGSRFASVSDCLRLINPVSDAIVGELSFNSFITDGVRCNIDTSFSTTFQIAFVLIKGDDITVRVDNTTLTGAQDVAQNITTLGVEPSFVELTTIVHSTQEVIDNEFQYSYGVAANDGSQTQRCVARQSRNGIGTAAEKAILWTNRIANGWQTTGTTTWELELTSFLSTGFQVTPRSTASANFYIYYIAIRCPSNSVAVGTYTGPTATGSHSNSSLTFKPQYLELLQSRITTSGSVQGNIQAEMLGVSFIGNAQQSISTTCEFNAGVTDVYSLANNTALDTANSSGAALNQATFTSFNSDGWTLNYSTLNSSSNLMPFLAIEEEAGGGGGLVVPVAQHHYRHRRVA